MLCGRTPRDSLVLQGSGVRIVVPGPVRTDPAQIARPVDLVFLAVKATQNAATAQWLAALSGPQTVVCVLQNGVEQLESVTALCPQGRVVPAVVWFPAQAQSDGSVLLRSDARISLPDEAASLVVAQALQGSRCLVDLVSNFRSLAWQKLLQNAAAGLMALTHRRSGMYGRHDISKLTLDYLQECLAVARAEGAELGDEVPQAILDKFQASPADLGTSILADRVRFFVISATGLARAAAGRAGFRPRSVMSWCRFLLPRATAPADHPCLDDKACDHRPAIRIQPETAGSTPQSQPCRPIFPKPGTIPGSRVFPARPGSRTGIACGRKLHWR
jgi:2-dehydropantoate 2-reductase